MRKPRRKDGAFRSLYIHQNGPRLALNAPAPQVSTEEAENIRKLECESYLEYRCSLRRSKPHGRSTEGGPFGCPTPSNSLGSSELSSSSSASSASSYSSSSSASHSSGPASESSYEDELNSADSFVDPDDFVSATSEDSEGSHSSSASWVSYSTSDSHGRRLSPPPGRHERVARMHDHQRRRDGGRGLWQRLMNALPNLCSAV
ncbi:hypothetical protein B0H16DRAFT_1598036 [Mycena metata]|uniref:Uncharacterized protein n=1 Tax=Mycena metata TaxID=1033252 RepID=A0AAD7HN74_9AGAR|nr:hypothetical protein B0H16DRAFT_1598036 [Mycena metata]